MSGEQLALDLPSKPAQGREDFFLSPSNALAVAALERWRDWPQGKLALIGPPGSGKTHLAMVWAEEARARVLRARDLTAAGLDALGTGNIVVEDADAPLGDAAQTALFHLHNLSLAHGARLLLTGATPPARWPVRLPDLASRLQAAAVAELDPPDDRLLAAVLSKLFQDRQIPPPAEVITWLVPRMERSFAAAQAVVAELDRRALARRCRISRTLAAEVLDKRRGGAP
ncbi:chromosomal replication initiator DnaA [Brevirhabdus sp.]|uniref:chromosomal replication initiator DnaA n=1 Tax=Brevirhabdus sp. TaxID=2004514 RepID=UPI004058FB99